MIKKKCKKCGNIFKFDNSQTFWDESGSGYSAKMVKCTHCDTIHVIKYVEDLGLHINNDKRYYE